MKRILTLVIVMLFGLKGFSQNQQKIIDSLKRELLKPEKDSIKAKIYGDLTWYYASISTDSALIYGKKAMVLAEKLHDSTFLAQTISDNGVVYYLKGDYETSEKLFRKSLKIRNLQKDSAGVASLNFKIGNIFSKKALLDSAMVYYLKALDFYEKKEAVVVANSLKSNIGTIYMTLKNYNKALEYFNENIEFFKNSDQQEFLGNALVNKATVYLYKKDTVQAIFNLKKGIEASEMANAYPTLGSAYNNLGTIYNNKKDFQQAKKYILKSIEIREKANLKTELESSKLTLAGIYNELGEFKKSKPLLLQNLKVFEKEELLDKLLLTYLQLIPVFAYEAKPDSVSFYTNKYIKTQEVYAQENMQTITSELETKYQTEKKEREILAQRANIAEKELNINRKNTQIIGLVILAVVLSFLGYLLYNQQKLKHIQLKKESELKEALIKIETQNKLQEQRLRISRDLHDNIGAQLTFIISSIDNLQYGFKINNEKLTNKLSNISAFTKETIYELRDTIWAMNKSKISFEDLQVRTSNFVDKANSISKDTNFEFILDRSITNQTVLTSIQGMNIYRIIQEAVNNSLKYSEAKNIKVAFKKLENTLQISITDDGKGFDIETVEMGNGLNNIKKRAHDISAIININSKLEEGTSIQLLFSLA
ncbi:MAG: tetratricopeptide repeat protein [Flavobacteriales bacterium]|nr:tetratricopeptide repeat protein [Flavobacteriia bacterium]NCP05791.1 tetratricopeptide repeat protein [Flavobacteriales bacterium]PIV94506.1 MAG: two-component sensor histidine kinase [Flavobacteriaceae bacterium CG17_big_fil_post_rev_8_21_14_2_50_33_15]PIY11307.1 MAG: two-component sensor histidine kinase [Flavobacteriaceae bacterium CG_4_10_14_3_um_filter_33_47]PJB20660.1 MAG: two-component sensor histidine kinase [Flavobacteriaceae bacterium CG_4_9_14_3_um_filter_33_16]